MKAGLRPKLSSARWQVPQVRPFPVNVFQKKNRYPFAMSACAGSDDGGHIGTQTRNSIGASRLSMPSIPARSLA